MRYAVVIEKARSNYSAYVPDLPGCVATGKTKAIVAQRLRRAILLHLRGLREDGIRVPKPNAVAACMEVSVDSNGKDSAEARVRRAS